jgi:4-hydroxy-3-polyprenylbenzoate decarboxylase
MFDNLNPATDIYFSQGPMDVLDHSCSKLGFGGKMCIDGTKKWEEEISEPLKPFIWDKSFEKGKIMDQFPEIRGISEQLAEKWQIPVLFISVEKNKKGHIATLHEAICKLPELASIKMVLYVEHTVAADDIPDVLWRLCNNMDPKRDHMYGGEKKNILGLDGTLKTKEFDGFERPWPNIVASDEATIASVDKKWPELGLGEKIKSPSLRYMTQLYGVEAAVLDND